MTIAYGVGLQMGWDRPYWAGFAVAFISLATVGQSLNKSTLRMVGTVVGAIAGLTLIGLFAQQRWLFIFFVSLWLALCAYMNAGNRYQYFWFVAGFVSLIIAADGGPNADNAFNIAMLRLQQTGLGILVYSLVTILLWPNHSGKSLQAAAKSHAANQKKLFSASLQWLREASDNTSVKTARAEEITGLGQVATLLDAAATDSEEVRQVERHWRAYQHASGEFAETMERWSENFSELQPLPLQQLFPELNTFSEELEQRLDSIGDMLGGAATNKTCSAVNPEINPTAAQQLSPFQYAAALVASHHMQQLEVLSRHMFDSSSAIGGFTDTASRADISKRQQAPWVPDPERLVASVKMMVVLWVAFLAVVYIGDFPGGFGFLSMSGAIGLVLVCNPQMPVRLLFAPVSVGILFGSALYIFVMPQLSSFIGLGTMIFLATFIICYRYASPQQGLSRAFGLAMLVTLISVSNQQSYNFLSVANSAMMFALLFLLLNFVSYFPYSPRPESTIVRLLNRYFSSAEFLLSQTAGGGTSALARRREAFHRQELASLPGKINTWATHADPKALGAASVQQLPGLVNSLKGLSYRLQELHEVRSLPQSPQLTLALQGDMLAWRDRVIATLQQLSGDPSFKMTLQRTGLDERLAALEKRIQQCLDGEQGIGLSSSDQQNFYRLLSAYRGTSEALLDFAQQAASVEWKPWYQERFA